MKERYNQRWAALLALGLAAGLLAGCAPALPPADSAASSEAASSEAASSGAASSEAASGGAAQTDAANPLDDGVLRYLYDLNSNGGGSLLRGAELIYRADPSESITLLNSPGADDPVGWQLGYNGPDGGRRTAVCDAGGALLWDGAGDWRADIAEGLLALTPGGYGVDYGPGGPAGCRLVDLADGSEIPLPADATGCIPVGDGRAVLTVNTDPGAGSLEGSAAVLYDLAAGAELARIEGAYAYRAYDDDGLSRCVAIQRYEDATDNWFTDLYIPDTGEVVPRFITFCGPDTICYAEGEGEYVVRTLADPEPLAVYGGRCAWWRPDLALVADEDGALTMVGDGRSELLFQYGTDTTNGEEAAILLADGRLVLRAPDGARTEVATGLESIRDEEGAWVSVLGVRDGVALLSVIDAANPEGVCRLYDASGLLYDTAGTGYQRLNELTAGPDGPVYAAPRFTPGRSGLLYDIVDAHGHVILSGLADVSAYGLPDGVFSARRGYERGYMDLAGEWLYRESVFTALGDDEGYGW